MFGWFKKKKKKPESEDVLKEPTGYKFKWHEIGPENPCNKRILDIRSFTSGMMATTLSESIAQRFEDLRSSVGDEYRTAKIPQGNAVRTNLVYPRNGTELNGLVFKADSMDCKWDIYAFDGYFFFTRSWSGELVYKAKTQNTSNQIIIEEIEYSPKFDDSGAINAVHFLMKSHAFQQIFPHRVPKSMIEDSDIALWSFHEFGNRACYATYDDITDAIFKSK